MRTNVFIDDSLLSVAFKLTKLKTKKELLNKALEEFIDNRKRKDLRDLEGKIQFKDDYDYKRMRA